MARGGKRKGAGAPKGNTNALKHGGRAKVLFGIPLDKQLTRFEYIALCLTRLDYISENSSNSEPSENPVFKMHNNRYISLVGINFNGKFHRRINRNKV